MSPNYDFQIARADEAAAEAEIASLINVRRRALRSEAAWRQIAVLTLKTDLAREAARIAGKDIPVSRDIIVDRCPSERLTPADPLSWLG